MDTASTLAWLMNLRNAGSSLGLERMRALSARLGSPESAAPCIHIAGTNGKGSTAAMIEAIQRAHGRTTGLYTSPHLIEIGERIQVNRQQLPTERVLEIAATVRPHYEALAAKGVEMTPTFFEVITAVAFLEFKRAKVDVVVLETGLGGRLDSTNICQPLVTVITSIGLDHQDFLGDTIEAIAGEKAGIIKPGVPCVISKVPAAAEAVLVAQAKKVGAPVHFVRDRFKLGLPETSLAGEHQQWNAGAAWLACELAARLSFNEVKARAALMAVNWGGRWQKLKLKDGHDLIIDGSHNEEGVRATESLLAELNKPTVVVGALGAERARVLLSVVAKHAGEIILVAPAHERACTIDEMKTLVPANYRGAVRASSVNELFPAAMECSVRGQVVVMGSLYLVGEVLARYEGKSPPHGSWQDKLSVKS
jgi:dihydrofolate synthase/folylpolyglutamate synthase